MDKLVSLQSYIARTRAARFVWGENDCALWAAGAVKACVGVDPAADLRGQYASRWECRQIEMRAGGLLQLVRARMDAVPGLTALDAPGSAQGVAVCRVDGLRLCCVLCGPRAFVRTQRGLRILDAASLSVEAGWSWHKL